MDTASGLLVKDRKGIYCPKAKVFLDPIRPVETAIISHGHADHARSGHQHYHCTIPTASILRKRLGNISVTTHEWRTPFEINGVECSFHPAGHVLGSAQIRLEADGEVWVFTGDFKRQSDASCEAFEPVACDALITEATFALPVYRWSDPEIQFDRMKKWIDQNQTEGVHSIFLTYSLGKAQRVLKGLGKRLTQAVWVHPSIADINACYLENDIRLPETRSIKDWDKHSSTEGARVILLPPAGLSDHLLKKTGQHRMAGVSGWATLRGIRRRSGYHAGFPMSDHADWPGLIQTIRDSGAQKVWVTHGQNQAFARYLKEIEHLHAEAWESLYHHSPDGEA